MNKTGIEWVTASWNCLRGCSWMSPGCDHCYAEQIAKRFGHAGQPYAGTYDYQENGWSGKVTFQEHKLDEPLKVKKPQLVFANSMSDVCHKEVQPEWIDKILDVIEDTPRHFYLMLTKRPHLIAEKFYQVTEAFPLRVLGGGDYLPNLAMGTSIESEKFLYRGYRLLEQWPGSCFLSLEPLLYSVSIKRLMAADVGGKIRQIIVGGESGKGSRKMEVDWVRRIRDETKEAGRAFFFKQWGDYRRPDLFASKSANRPRFDLGRTLDGREWNESPWPVPLLIDQPVKF